MKKIELKGICSEVEITLNNLFNCRVEESEDGVSVVFDSEGMKIVDPPRGKPEADDVEK